MCSGRDDSHVGNGFAISSSQFNRIKSWSRQKESNQTSKKFICSFVCAAFFSNCSFLVCVKVAEKCLGKRGIGGNLIGEMMGHSDAINSLLQVTENSFASCSSDTTVILWKVIPSNLCFSSFFFSFNSQLGFCRMEKWRVN